MSLLRALTKNHKQAEFSQIPHTVFMHCPNGLPVYFIGKSVTKMCYFVCATVFFPPVAMIFNALRNDDYEISFGIDLPEVLANRH